MNKIERQIICIVCPTGCRIQVSGEDPEQLTVTGNECRKGEQYALKEVTNPTRTLITTVRINGAPLRRLPVRTNDEIPKQSIFPCMEIINAAEVEAPVEVGQVIVPDILGTGVDIIATRSMPRV